MFLPSLSETYAQEAKRNGNKSIFKRESTSDIRRSQYVFFKKSQKENPQLNCAFFSVCSQFIFPLCPIKAELINLELHQRYQNKVII